MQRQLAEQLKQIFDTHVADKMSVFPSNANFVLTKGSAAQQLDNTYMNKDLNLAFMMSR